MTILVSAKAPPLIVDTSGFRGSGGVTLRKLLRIFPER